MMPVTKKVRLARKRIKLICDINLSIMSLYRTTYRNYKELLSEPILQQIRSKVRLEVQIESGDPQTEANERIISGAPTTKENNNETYK